MSPRVQTLPPGTQRFFARIDSFTCECPRCGQIIQARFDRNVSQVRRQQAQQKFPTTRQSRGGEGRRLTYNPLSSRLVCPSCRRTFGVGLLVYPVKPRSTGRQPYDTRPTYQQILEIRRLAGGFLVPKQLATTDTVNLFVEQECTCPEAEATCPVHGKHPADPDIVSPIRGGEEDQ